MTKYAVIEQRQIDESYGDFDVEDIFILMETKEKLEKHILSEALSGRKVRAIRYEEIEYTTEIKLNIS